MNKKGVSMESANRTEPYQRNKELEHLLKELNELLGPVEDKLAANFSKPRYPVLLLVGGPRSGSTVFMQYLAQLGVFAYPSNLLSRFYRMPYIGAKIHLLLTHPKYNFRNEIMDFSSSFDYQSDIGKTRGALQPNEFWHFWRRFIPNSEPAWLTPEEEKQIDGTGLLSELAALEQVFDMPLAMKALILEQNIPYLSSLFGSALFVYCKRHPFFIIQSLLECREKFFGSREKWYSTKPKQYNELIKMDPISQVTGQVYFGMKIIEEGLAALPPQRKLTIEYEWFCEHPEHVFNLIVTRYAKLGYTINIDYNGRDNFASANTIRLSEGDRNSIIDAYKSFSGIALPF